MHTYRRLLTRAGIAALLMTPLFSWADDTSPSHVASVGVGVGPYAAQEVGNRKGERGVVGGQIVVTGDAIAEVPKYRLLLGGDAKLNLRYGSQNGGTDTAKANKTVAFSTKALAAGELRLSPDFALLLGGNLSVEGARSQIVPGEKSKERAPEKEPVIPNQTLFGVEPFFGLLSTSKNALVLFTPEFLYKNGEFFPEVRGGMYGGGFDLQVVSRGIHRFLDSVDAKVSAGFVYGDSLKRKSGSPGFEAYSVHANAQVSARVAKYLSTGAEFKFLYLYDEGLDRARHSYVSGAFIGIRPDL